jgi:DNA-binding transcriptional regulator of glucitol operon
MKKVSLAVLFSLGAMASAAYAQTDQGVTMSTDPSKIADVESRAQALQSRQDSMQSAPAPAPMSHHGKMKHHKKPKAAPAQ